MPPLEMIDGHIVGSNDDPGDPLAADLAHQLMELLESNGDDTGGYELYEVLQESSSRSSDSEFIVVLRAFADDRKRCYRVNVAFDG